VGDEDSEIPLDEAFALFEFDLSDVHPAAIVSRINIVDTDKVNLSIDSKPPRGWRTFNALVATILG
jgi:hypothetical protein